MQMSFSNKWQLSSLPLPLPLPRPSPAPGHYQQESAGVVLLDDLQAVLHHACGLSELHRAVGDLISHRLQTERRRQLLNIHTQSLILYSQQKEKKRAQAFLGLLTAIEHFMSHIIRSNFTAAITADHCSRAVILHNTQPQLFYWKVNKPLQLFKHVVS